jgi:hypothetical protein
VLLATPLIRPYCKNWPENTFHATYIAPGEPSATITCASLIAATSGHDERECSGHPGGCRGHAPAWRCGEPVAWKSALAALLDELDWIHAT